MQILMKIGLSMLDCFSINFESIVNYLCKLSKKNVDTKRFLFVVSFMKGQQNNCSFQREILRDFRFLKCVYWVVSG